MPLLECTQQENTGDDSMLKIGEIHIQDGTFSWENLIFKKIFAEEKKKENKKKNEVNDKKIEYIEEKQEEVLKDINLKVSCGEFLGVIGKVGSGKSSLVSAMINEIVTVKGKSTKNGKVAYIAQEAFLLNDTIKNNILFGEEYNEEKFKRVLKICELEDDLNILVGREYTQIGERGINLSGGQKQ